MTAVTRHQTQEAIHIFQKQTKNSKNKLCEFLFITDIILPLCLCTMEEGRNNPIYYLEDINPN